MHAVNVAFVDKDHLVSKWTSFEGGKEKETMTFTLARKN